MNRADWPTGIRHSVTKAYSRTPDKLQRREGMALLDKNWGQVTSLMQQSATSHDAEYPQWGNIASTDLEVPRLLCNAGPGRQQIHCG